MLYPILSWWHLARNRQSLTLQGDSHHNKSRWLEENPCAESVGPELYRQENKHGYNIRQKIKLMDVKRSAKTKRRSDHVLRDLSKVQKHVLDLETPVKDKKDNLCVKVLRRKLRKGKEGVDVTLGRQTVIRNLPQLQKLDNVPVSSEEMVRSFFRIAHAD